MECRSKPAGVLDFAGLIFVVKAKAIAAAAAAAEAESVAEVVVVVVAAAGAAAAAELLEIVSKTNFFRRKPARQGLVFCAKKYHRRPPPFHCLLWRRRIPIHFDL